VIEHEHNPRLGWAGAALLGLGAVGAIWAIAHYRRAGQVRTPAPAPVQGLGAVYNYNDEDLLYFEDDRYLYYDKPDDDFISASW
jgi:hypothetical protein